MRSALTDVPTVIQSLTESQNSSSLYAELAKKMVVMNAGPLEKPRIVGRQTHRSNPVTESAEDLQSSMLPTLGRTSSQFPGKEI